MQANTTDIFYLTILNSNQTSSLMVSHTSHEGVRGLPERRASGNRRNIENTDCHSDCNDSKIMQSAPKSQGARCANLCVALLAQLMPAHQRRAASGNRRAQSLNAIRSPPHPFRGSNGKRRLDAKCFAFICEPPRGTVASLLPNPRERDVRIFDSR